MLFKFLYIIKNDGRIYNYNCGSDRDSINLAVIEANFEMIDSIFPDSDFIEEELKRKYNLDAKKLEFLSKQNIGNILVDDFLSKLNLVFIYLRYRFL